MNHHSHTQFCTCCQSPITRQNYDCRHVYRFGVYHEFAPRQVALIGSQQRAVCRHCAARIEYAHQYRKRRKITTAQKKANEAGAVCATV
jgi:hypothetical protein